MNSGPGRRAERRPRPTAVRGEDLQAALAEFSAIADSLNGAGEETAARPESA